MREASFFWKRDRLGAIEIAPLLDVAHRIEFLSYINRVPKDIQCLLKFHLKEGVSISDIDSLDFLDVIDVMHESTKPEEGHLIICRIIHPLSNLNARTKGTYAVPGSRLDENGFTYIIQGPSLKLRLMSGVMRLMSKPDRTSARNLNLTPQNYESILSEKQLKLAKFAYDHGYYDLPKRIKITELSEQMGLARATVSEHLTKIEGILMDDIFSSMTDVRLSPEDARSIVLSMEIDMQDSEALRTEGFESLIQRMKDNITLELTQDTHEFNEIDSSKDPEEILSDIRKDIG
jgi:DNA-binding MarR family transcriptional regulator